MSLSNNFIKRSLYLEAERMAFLSSALDQEKFDTEREVVKNERRQRMENAPYGLADETIASHVFPPGHPYSWSVIGSMKDLNNATLNDLRQFFYEFYHPANATLTLVGGFDPAEARQWIEAYFGSISRGPAAAPIKVPPTPPLSQRITQKDRVQFPRVYWNWPTVSESDADGFPTCEPLPEERGIRAYAHIDAMGTLKASSFHETGVRIDCEGLMKAVAQLSRELKEDDA